MDIFAEKVWFCQRNKLWSWSSNFSHELKTVWNNLSFFILKCKSIYETLLQINLSKSYPFVLNRMKITFHSNDNSYIRLTFCFKYTNRRWNPSTAWRRWS